MDDAQSDVDSDDSMELQRFDTEVCLPKGKTKDYTVFLTKPCSDD